MNKIDIEQNKIFLNNDIYYLNIKDEKKINVEVTEGSKNKVIILGEATYEIVYSLHNNSELTVYSINKDNSVKITVNLEENSKVIYHHSITSNVDSNNLFTINHLANNSTSHVYNNGINRANNQLFFEINGIIPKKLVNIVCSQNSQIINYQDGNSKIIPNLIIDSNDIVASHAAYIGNIDKELKFYLASRGITEESIKKLIYKAVLLGKMELEKERDLFNKVINEWW